MGTIEHAMWQLRHGVELLDKVNEPTDEEQFNEALEAIDSAVGILEHFDFSRELLHRLKAARGAARMWRLGLASLDDARAELHAVLSIASD